MRRLELGAEEQGRVGAIGERGREGEVRVVLIGVGGWAKPGTPAGVGEAVAGAALAGLSPF